MRWFALYLPQFHEIPENNEWWKPGFTEWTHVKAARPLFKGHEQPVIPLNENYYNLMDKKTVQWQTDMMKQYGIDGFVYYHYYFRGKKLLEKPAENLLEWQEIDQPFFFCWANHSWYQAKNGTKKLLLEQTYGHESDWEEHFQYLLPFFTDKRYEKKDNKPVFMIYISNFKEKHELIAYFDKRCKDEGFDGIYVIETFADSLKSLKLFQENACIQTQQIYVREPSVSYYGYNEVRNKSLATRLAKKFLKALSQKGIIHWVEKYNGNDLYDLMQKSTPYGKDKCHGVFFSWDNTPRHDVRGYIITPPSKDRFLRYADSIKNDEYVFINAWNEWAEGMVLEPTVQNGYKFLSWIDEWNKGNE